MTLNTTYSPAVADGNGVTTNFSYSFDPISISYLKVSLEINGVWVQQLSGWTATTSPNGGIVTFATAPTTRVAIERDVPEEQPTSYETSSGFQAKVIEHSFDMLTGMVQQLQEKSGRSVAVEVGSDVDPQQVVVQVERVYQSIDNIDDVADDLANINAAQADLTNIDTVAGSISDVNTVASDIANVNTVAGDLINVDTVANDISAVNTCASNMSEIQDAPTQANNAAESANKSQVWAEGSDADVSALGGIHSAKGWANQEANNYSVTATGSTTSRTLKDRFADIINVKDFGAKGDGVTDDTTAFQAALDEQAITGAKIFVPAGQYNVQNLTYKSKLEIFGDGNPTSTIVFTGTSGALLSPDTGVNPFASNISDISFSGSLGTCFVGRTDGSNRGITFKNVYINGFTVGIQLSDAFNNAIRDCKISSCGKGILYKSITWIATDSVTGDIIENCYFNGNTVAGLCVDSGGAFNTITLINDIFEVNEIGVLGDDSYRITMIGCYFEKNVSGGATLKRGIDINCFCHSSNGNNVITYTTGASYTNSQILMTSSSKETFKVYNDAGLDKSRLTRPDVVGILKMGSSSTDNIGHIDCTTATRMNIGVSGNHKVSLLNSAFIPYENDAYNLGSSARMWKEIFCGNGTINTSDERQKQNIENIDERVFKAWGKVEFKQFLFKDAVEQKGDKARIHFGVIAQKVKEAFESEGLDGFRYGLLCYDEWDDEFEDIEVVDKEAVIDENGEIITPQETHIEQKLVVKAGNAYGIRYTEALALECAYQRWKLEQMQKQLDNQKAL